MVSNNMCHLQDVCDESSAFTMSFIEKMWRSFMIRCNMLKLNIFYLRERFRYPLTLITRRDKSITEISAENSYVPLKRGDVVKVKPFKEIQQTLDEKGFYKGMLFINEMVQYCGGTYKVFKRVNKVFIPRHGKMSKCRETVLLDGVFCNGYGPDIYCTRTCFFFWKEAWLEKIE